MSDHLERRVSRLEDYREADVRQITELAVTLGRVEEICERMEHRQAEFLDRMSMAESEIHKLRLERLHCQRDCYARIDDFEKDALPVVRTARWLALTVATLLLGGILTALTTWVNKLPPSP